MIFFSTWYFCYLPAIKISNERDGTHKNTEKYKMLKNTLIK